MNDSDPHDTPPPIPLPTVPGLTEVGGLFARFADPGQAEPASFPSIPRHEVVALLGRGGMGKVWLARNLRLGRLVAVKTIRAELLEEPGRLERFRVETRPGAGGAGAGQARSEAGDPTLAA